MSSPYNSALPSTPAHATGNDAPACQPTAAHDYEKDAGPTRPQTAEIALEHHDLLMRPQNATMTCGSDNVPSEPSTSSMAKNATKFPTTDKSWSNDEVPVKPLTAEMAGNANDRTPKRSTEPFVKYVEKVFRNMSIEPSTFTASGNDGSAKSPTSIENKRNDAPARAPHKPWWNRSAKPKPPNSKTISSGTGTPAKPSASNKAKGNASTAKSPTMSKPPAQGKPIPQEDSFQEGHVAVPLTKDQFARLKEHYETVLDDMKGNEQLKELSNEFAALLTRFCSCYSQQEHISARLKCKEKALSEVQKKNATVKRLVGSQNENKELKQKLGKVQSTSKNKQPRPVDSDEESVSIPYDTETVKLLVDERHQLERALGNVERHKLRSLLHQSQLEKSEMTLQDFAKPLSQMNSHNHCSEGDLTSTELTVSSPQPHSYHSEPFLVVEGSNEIDLLQKIRDGNCKNRELASQNEKLVSKQVDYEKRVRELEDSIAEKDAENARLAEKLHLAKESVEQQATQSSICGKGPKDATTSQERTSTTVAVGGFGAVNHLVKENLHLQQCVEKLKTAAIRAASVLERKDQELREAKGKLKKATESAKQQEKNHQREIGTQRTENAKQRREIERLETQARKFCTPRKGQWKPM